jgi:hypothetical protein
MTVKRAVMGLIAGFAVIALMPVAVAAQQAMPKTTRESIRGSAQVTTEKLRGTVVFVEGNHLVVRMSNGDIREFNPPESRRFLIDGQEVTVRDLKPGTKLTATVTTTRTSVTDRTTTVGSGKVWWVAGTTVILTLPNGENRTYKVTGDYKFNVEGKEATVFELRKGMQIAAQKIVEEPRTEIAADTVVTGQAPPPPVPQPVVAETRPAPAPREVAQARPAPTPEPAPVPQAEAQPKPTKVPATASELPLVGILGLLFMSAGLYLRRISRSGNG